ncbi:bifunctional tetrahydrofolate synthase/dihydrofolate synthase [Neptunomonas antarctica]|uniref:Dihydrofolate synthase/folylpolyglutamate synthase n=1 Tax=Neptunomonas antarctica TaxID=619304 RepID=A0A1N7PHV6_9GAMM|nr:bifunctional tetrahydrofolate synthase/dihydrofolate synthase [Neptunomonas antarctica]SIT10100.1 dihydrofolate synthase / folylpolyglutamate synthase [Neptunomonas antarctica]
MNRSEFTLEQWLRWMEQSHPVAIDLGLERVQKVFSRLVLNFQNVCIITVAGTNGKGSTVAMLDAIYREAGYTTACYTSPHLQVYNERIRLNGVLVTDDQLVAAFQAVDQVCEEITLTYFEMGTLAALWLVAQQQPDVALLEVGLGGRLDAINVVDPDVSVITTIDIDHVDWLGDDREKIGWEKAGIFRTTKPAVCGELHPPASIASYAQALGASLYQVNSSYEYHIKDAHWCWQGEGKDKQQIIFTDLPIPRLPIQNAATAIQAIMLAGLPCCSKSIKAGLQKASVAGRMDETLYQGHSFILDVAHNPQSAAYLAKQLQKLDNGSGECQVELILGMLADKDCAAVIDALKPVVSFWHLVTLDVPRGQTAEQLKLYLKKIDIDSSNVVCHNSVAEAIESLVVAKKVAMEERSGVHRVVVAGSFHTVGDAYHVFKREIN